MIISAPSWNWIIAANVLLGVNQGLAWSMTVIMKIDLVGPKSRGLGVGLNEFAGCLAVGATAFITGYIAATTYTFRPEPLYIGIAYAVFGLVLSVLVIRDTSEHVRLEAIITRKCHLSDSATCSRAHPFAIQRCLPHAKQV